MTVILHLSSCCDEAVNKKSNKLKKEKKSKQRCLKPRNAICSRQSNTVHLKKTYL